MVTVAVDTADVHTTLASTLYMLVAAVVANVVKDVAQVAWVQDTAFEGMNPGAVTGPVNVGLTLDGIRKR